MVWCLVLCFTVLCVLKGREEEGGCAAATVLLVVLKNMSGAVVVGAVCYCFVQTHVKYT